MTEIGDAIRTGASAFLRREYLSLVPFRGCRYHRAGRDGLHCVQTQLGYTGHRHFLPGRRALLRPGRIHRHERGGQGEYVRTAAAAMIGLNPALRIAFSSGTVMGVTVVGIGLLGVTILYV